MPSIIKGRWILVFLGLVSYLYGWREVGRGEIIPQIMATLGVEDPGARFPWEEIMKPGFLAFIGGGLTVSMGALQGAALVWRDKRRRREFWAHLLWAFLPAFIVLVLAGPALRLFLAFLASGGIIAWLFQSPVGDKGIY
ncbi:MAG TPA: hypothetical protein GX711_07580 [Clostridia bacterium]|nr:hypothetical protein [Clostridia bacterium]